MGCNPSVPDVVDKKDLSSGSVTIGGEEKYAFKDSAIMLRLSPGRHSVPPDGEKPLAFFVGDGGGLLNLDSQAYVACEIKYTEPGNEGKADIFGMEAKAASSSTAFGL